MKLGVNENISNADYHGDRQFFSSSALKLIHKDREEFYRKYILGEGAEIKNQAALDFGTAAHLAILEPHLFNTEVVVYDKGTRRGKLWEDFKEEHKGKVILTAPEISKLNALIEEYRICPHGPNLVLGCLFEHTLCEVINDVNVKVRCDGINIDRGYIIDVKTTGYECDKDSFSMTVNDLYYDLSAALYCSVAKKIYNKDFDFYFIVLGKQSVECKVYKLSEATKAIGMTRLFEAIEILKKCRLTNDYSYDSLNSEDNDDENKIQEV